MPAIIFLANTKSNFVRLPSAWCCKIRQERDLLLQRSQSSWCAPLAPVDLGSARDTALIITTQPGEEHSWEDTFCAQKINKYNQGPSALTPLDISICVRCLDLQNAGKPVCGRGLSGQKVGKNLDPRCYTEVATSELLHMPNGKCHCYLRHVWFHLPLCFRQKHPERCV